MSDPDRGDVLRINDKAIGEMLSMGGIPDLAVRKMALIAWNRIDWSTAPSAAAYRYAKNIEGTDELGQLGFAALAEWAQAGYLHLETSHKFAAALMCTQIAIEDADEAVDALAGGVAFLRVPDGILFGARINRAFVAFVESEAGYKGACVWAWEAGAFDTRAIGALDSVSSWCTDQSIKRDPETLIFRLAIGLVLTMRHTADFRDRHVSPREGGRAEEREDPPHRVCFIGRPIKVDCRPALREYISGDRRSPPSVQSVVRGHYKRQVVGIGRSGRKVIWVQPYWRGPEEAAILVRPIRVGDSP